MEIPADVIKAEIPAVVSKAYLPQNQNESATATHSGSYSPQLIEHLVHSALDK